MCLTLGWWVLLVTKALLVSEVITVNESPQAESVVAVFIDSLLSGALI
jgi:hypothetical protein